MTQAAQAPPEGSESSDVTYLVPIGFQVGFIPRPSGTDIRPAVRLSGIFTWLDEDALELWWQARFRLSRADLMRWAAANDVSEPDEILDALISNGLIFELGARNAERFLRDYAIAPLAIGTGYDEETGLYTIRDHGMVPLLSVDNVSYTLWSMSDGYRSMESIGKFIAESRGIPYRQLAPQLAGTVPALLQSNVVSLDLAVARS